MTVSRVVKPGVKWSGVYNQVETCHGGASYLYSLLQLSKQRRDAK